MSFSLAWAVSLSSGPAAEQQGHCCSPSPFSCTVEDIQRQEPEESAGGPGKGESGCSSAGLAFSSVELLSKHNLVLVDCCQAKPSSGPA